MRRAMLPLLLFIFPCITWAATWSCRVVAVYEVGKSGRLAEVKKPIGLHPAMRGDQWRYDDETGALSAQPKSRLLTPWQARMTPLQRGSAQNPALGVYQDQDPVSAAARQVRIDPTVTPATLMYVGQYGAVVTGTCERAIR